MSHFLIMPFLFISLAYFIYKTHEVGKLEKEQLAILRGIELRLQYIERKM